MANAGVMVGGVKIGGGAPVSIQSMTTTDTRDVAETLRQIKMLEDAGCDIVRVAVYDEESATAIARIKNGTSMPIVADIQFDYRLGILAIESGADKLRFNPGNIGGEGNVRVLLSAAKTAGIPIRVGVNAGSIEKEILAKYGPTPEAMVESTLRSLHVLEREGFYDTVLSLKASNVRQTVEAYQLISQKTGYPMHVGVTEAGRGAMGIVKSSVGIGALLVSGIGDTIRVSLTGDPVKEVRAAQMILNAAGLRRDGIEIIACPTCGRCSVELEEIVKRVEASLPQGRALKPLKVAIMGCVVNGPGEAREADIGIAFGETGGVIFKRGEKYSAPLPEVIDVFINEIINMAF